MTNANSHDWSKIINAIAQVESGGNPKAVNKTGNCVGLLQITPILVKECNLILESKGEEKRYTLEDRLDPDKSKEMFVLIQGKYNKSNDEETAIRLWNGGVGNLKNKEKTQVYYEKVLKAMNNA